MSLVNFSRRYGKSIGGNRFSHYQLNEQINEQIKQTNSDEDKRKLFNNYLPEIFKQDLILCSWLYYESYDEFISEFKEYVLTLNNDEFNLALKCNTHLRTIVEIFWMEKNDPTLKEEFTNDTKFEEYKKTVKKFDEKDTKYDGFKLILKQLYYKFINQNVYDRLSQLNKDLNNARFDDILQMRTEEEWKILYSLRYLYKDVVNKINHPIDLEQYTKTELYSSKKKLEDYLMLYQETIEYLNWHNPYYNKLIENIEYFPRATSKPPYEYAYADYYNLEENAISNVEEMIEKRKRKREEVNNQIAGRFNRIRTLMEERNNRIKTIAKYLNYGIGIVIGLIAVMYYYL
jgi:hypothetical protein